MRDRKNPGAGNPSRGARAALLLALTASLFAGAAPARTASHPFGVQDMIDMRRVSSPVPSPDGRWIVFELRTYSLESNKGSADLWLVSPDGGEPKPLTTHQAQDFGATWSPDSRRIAFLSTRSGSSQVWTIPVDGGEATQTTDLPLDVDGVHWSPDGSRLALAMAVYPDCPDLQCTADRDREKADPDVQAKIIDSLLFRHWDTWEDGKRNHVFSFHLADGETMDLMQGMDLDCPTVPWGGTEEFTWKPQSHGMLFTAQQAEHPERSTDYQIFSVALDGNPPLPVTENPAWDTAPSYSPDGKTVAWLSMKRAGYESDRFRLVLRDAHAGPLHVLTESWDRSISAFSWAPDSRSILVTADDEGKKPIFRVAVKDGSVTRLTEGGYHAGASALPDGRIVYLRDSLTSPAEIWIAAADGSDARSLTSFNAERLRAVQMSWPEEFWFAGAGGDRVHGWFLPPVGFEKGKRYPLVYIIHGGPQGSSNDHFHYRWNPQAYAGRGYAVAMVDFHGSTGYGQAFTDSINRDWGGKPFEDLMLGLDHVLQTYPWIDPKRLGAAGASYGGYMINWLAGHTDRFRALVNHDGLFSTRSMYYTTEELWFPEWDLGGTPWESKEIYERWDPSESIASWKTPMLVVHGALDYRVVESEGFSTFTALQRRGVPSRLLYFPDEDHWVLKPRNMKVWHDTVLDWLDRFLKEGGS